MNKKQCQKCGEENPPEAVMCWACYTPLGSGGAAAAASTPSRTPAKDDSDKKPIPKWQIGVVAAALIVGIGMGVKTLMPPADDPFGSGDTSSPPGKTTNTQTGNPIPPPVPGDPGIVNKDAPTVVQPPQSIQQQPLLQIAVPANPRIEMATMGIVPTDPNVDESKAASLAVLAYRNLINARRWRRLQIYVFSDQQAAAMFKNYQKKRKGAPLTVNDYQNLTELWRRTPAVYEFNGKYERWVSPAKSPADWWNHWPDFTPRAV